MTAKEKFQLGRRVKSTLLALQYGVVNQLTIGKVVGFSRTDVYVQIRRQGYTTPRIYHMDFWEPIKTKEPG